MTQHFRQSDGFASFGNTTHGTTRRHSHASWNPEVWRCCNFKTFLQYQRLDSRLRGNDGYLYTVL